MPGKIRPAELSPDRVLGGVGVAALVAADAVEPAGEGTPDHIPRAHVMIHFGVHGACPAADHHVAPLGEDPHAGFLRWVLPG
ncbi:MAG: hypothetical protein ACRD0P_22150 [Stackebrandtia sp.]